MVKSDSRKTGDSMALEETVLSMVICSFTVIPLVIIGIVQYHSKTPVGFWSGREPPKKEEVIDVKAYNQKHGMMWIIYGIGLFVSFLLGSPFGGGVAAIAAGVECIGGIFLMIVYHNSLNHKYLREGEDG